MVSHPPRTRAPRRTSRRGPSRRLVPASPQGINPSQLILDLVVTPRPGTWPQVMTSVSVRYDHGPDIDDETVLIREPDGDAVGVDVDVVS